MFDHLRQKNSLTVCGRTFRNEVCERERLTERIQGCTQTMFTDKLSFWKCEVQEHAKEALSRIYKISAGHKRAFRIKSHSQKLLKSTFGENTKVFVV